MDDEFRPKWDPKKHDESVEKVEEKHHKVTCPECGSEAWIQAFTITLIEIPSQGKLAFNWNVPIPKCLGCGKAFKPQELIGHARKGVRHTPDGEAPSTLN